MKIKNKQSGLTIVELLVVIGIIAAVVAISLPAINAMQKSFDSTGAEGMINAALSTARTLAISRQQYVGVRFQKAWKLAENILDSDQYMIFVMFVESKEAGNNLDAFRTIDGYKPMKLPANIGVADLTGITALGNDTELSDATTFSVVFSPAGKLVIHEVRIRFRDNDYPDYDDVFNTISRVDSGNAMFVYDDDADPANGINKEQSRDEFVIYNCEEFKKITNPTDRYNYLNDSSKMVYINPYTGGIIEK